MSESKPGIDQISSFIEKNGISTLLLIAGIYVGYTSFLKPAGDKYVEMIESVTKSNESLTQTISELKDGMVQVGQANTTIGNKNTSMLERIDDHLKELEVISRDIQNKLGEMRQPRYFPQPEPINEPVDP